MDLYNNHVGRRLASDPVNAGLPPAIVILNALSAGQLVTGTAYRYSIKCSALE